MKNEKVVLITGAAKRVGADIAKYLHHRGMKIAIHYNTSKKDAEQLTNELNQIRNNSAVCYQAELLNTQSSTPLINKVVDHWGQLDVLINNASSFYPTPLGKITEDQFNDLIGTNLKAPLFLSQAAAPYLTITKGSIINIIDIHAKNPLRSYITYCAAKAGLAMLTRSFAKELGPNVRVNGVAPGPILWPDEVNTLDAAAQEKIINHTALKRSGSPQDLASAIYFFIEEAPYITGQILAVDGGRSLNF